MGYLKRTQDDVLKLSASEMRLIKWCIDGSYAIQNDCKMHTGGVIFMSIGAIYSTSRKKTKYYQFYRKGINSNQ